MSKILSIIKRNLWWAILLVYLIISFGFIHKKESVLLCNKLSITVVDSAYNAFVRPKDVLSILRDKNLIPLHHKLDSINLNKIESSVIKNQSIEDVNVYKTIDGVVNINISQRKPIVRVINYNGESYYIDEKGYVMSLSKNYTSRILIALGQINEPLNLRTGINFSKIDTTFSEMTQNSKLFEIFKIAKYINEDKFLRSLIDQIYINDDNEIELIAKINPSSIILGTIDNYEKKLKKLKIFYKKGLPKLGWNKYKSINLVYKNQIVCVKR